MPGLAQSNQFLLSTATVMVGALADLHNLNPAEHSIGLVKNFQMTADPTYVELTQGIRNDVVMSVRNADGIKCSMEAYEFTLRNIAYGAGLDASGATFDPVGAIYATSEAPTGTTVKVSTDITANVPAGSYIFVQNSVTDVVHIAKVASTAFATTVTTITLAAGFAIPASVTFPANARVGVLKRVDVGGTTVQPELAAKVVGLLPKNNEPFTILFPKIKITKGLGVAFQSDNFSNMPFEFTPYAGIPGDPMYTEYGAVSAILFPR